MKILLLTEFFPDQPDPVFTGGVEARTYFIAKNLAKTDKVMVICRKSRKLNRVQKLKNLTIFPCGPRRTRVEASIFSAGERLLFMFSSFIQGSRLDFDLVEGSNFVVYLPAFFLGLIKRKPSVAWIPDLLGANWRRYFGIAGFFGQLLEKISLKLPWRRIISLSKRTKEKIIKAGGDKKKIEVVYGGVETEKFKIKKLKFKTGEKKIISISRLVKYKRVGDIIRAFAKLEKTDHLLKLNIVGEGPEEKKLKSLAVKEGVKNKVRFIKNIEKSKLDELLKKSFLLCHASIIEGFGLVVIEAASHQVPYVISDIRVHREIALGGKGGLFFKKKDFLDLAAKAELLLKNQKLYQQKQREGWKLAQKYDWQKIASQTKKVYHKALNGKI